MRDIVDQLAEIIKGLPDDLRAEVVIADMLERGLNSDAILVRSKSLFRRKFSRDVERMATMDVGAKQKYTVVEINREGMYDALPQAITHGSKHVRRTTRKNAGEMADEVKQRRREENAARKFFLPFENEFHHQRINLEIEERNILKGLLSNTRYAILVNRLWQLPAILDARQKATFMYLVPIIYKAVGNFTLTRLCYEAILAIKVDFAVVSGSEQKGLESCAMKKGRLVLGANFVCGNQFRDYKQTLKIVLEPLNNDQLVEYLPGEKGRDIIEFLNEYYLPYDTDWEISLRTNSYEENFILKDGVRAPRLGLTTRL